MFWCGKERKDIKKKQNKTKQTNKQKSRTENGNSTHSKYETCQIPLCSTLIMESFGLEGTLKII